MLWVPMCYLLMEMSLLFALLMHCEAGIKPEIAPH